MGIHIYFTWVPLKAEPEARTWVQVLFISEVLPRSGSERVRKMKPEGERPIKGVLINCNCCRRLGFTPPGDFEKLQN